MWGHGGCLCTRHVQMSVYFTHTPVPGTWCHYPPASPTTNNNNNNSNSNSNSNNNNNNNNNNRLRRTVDAREAIVE